MAAHEAHPQLFETVEFFGGPCDGERHTVGITDPYWSVARPKLCTGVLEFTLTQTYYYARRVDGFHLHSVGP